MDILNFISWIRGRRKVTTVDPAKTLLPVAIKDNRRDDGYITGAISVADFANQIAPQASYKVYTALLTQTGTDAPVATVLENTIGDIVWTYDSTGFYKATLLNSFPYGKTVFLFGNTYSSVNLTADCLNYNTSNSIMTLFVSSISSGNPVDSSLANTPIEIRVYN